MTETVDLGKPSTGTPKDRRLHENDCGKGLKAGPNGTCIPAEADAEHFTAGADLASDAPWNGSPSRFTDAQYEAAAAACGPAGEGTVKERCFLPHHEPGGALNVNGLHSSAQRASSLKGRSPAAVAKAKTHLRAHYSQVGEEPPDSIAAALELTAAEAAALEALGPNSPPGRRIEPMPSGGCPPGTMPGPDGKTCLPNDSAGDLEHLADAPAGALPVHWRGVITVEGIPTGDGREFAPDSLDWPDPAEVTLAFQWQKESSHGGDHDVTVAVGRIDKIWREPAEIEHNGGMVKANLIYGEGRFDTHADAEEAHRRMDAGMLNGTSIGADDITDAEVEYVFPESEGTETGDDDILHLLFGKPEKVVFHKARIRATTLCDVPAFVQATLQSVNEGDAPQPAGALVASLFDAVAPHVADLSHGPWLAAEHEARLPRLLKPEDARAAYAYVAPTSGDVDKGACRFLHHEITDGGLAGPANVSACLVGIQAVHTTQLPEHEKAAVYRHLAAHLADAGEEAPPYEPHAPLAAHAWQEDLWTPPAEWFRDPQITQPIPIMVTNEGRVYGLASEWTECHLGYMNECVRPPREDYHAYYLTGEQPLDDGSTVAVGTITAGIGHAPTNRAVPWMKAKEHYDNTEAVVAHVAIGNCKAGIWVAGGIVPWAQSARVQQLRASGQVSPDWRPIGGRLRMVGLLAVNESGFQVPRARVLVADGQIQALIMSGLSSVARIPAPDEAADLRAEMDRLHARVHS